MMGVRANQYWLELLSFWRWWIDELAALIPYRLKRLFDASPVAIIYPSASCVEIDRIAGGEGQRFLETRPLEAFDAENWAEFEEITRRCQIHIVLRAPQIYTLAFDLPKAVRGHWRSAAVLQLEAVAPVVPEQLVWNGEVVARTANSIRIELVLAREVPLMRIQSLFEARDLHPPPIDGEWENGRLALMAGRASPNDPDVARWHKSRLVALLMLVSVPVTTIIGANLARWGIDNANHVRANTVAPKLAAERRWQGEDKTRSALSLGARRPTISAVVEDVAKALPKQSYAQAIERGRDRSLLLTISSASPRAAAEALGKIPSLNGLVLVDQTANGGEVTITLRQGPQ